MNSKWNLNCLCFTVLLSVSLPPAASGDSVAQIFPKNGAATPFSESIETTKQDDYQYFPGIERVELGAPSKKKEEKVSKSEAVKSPEIKKSQEKLTEEEAIKQWGDPDIDFPVTSVKDAPLPFQNMVKALNAGYTDLAKRYARQFLKYINDVKENTRKAQELYKKVLIEEKLYPGSPPLADGETPFDKKQKTEVARGKPEERFDEEEARRQVRSVIKDTVPVDPFGEVDVYFFFKMDDENSVLMLSELDKLYKKAVDDKKLTLRGFSFDVARKDELSKFALKHKVGFPLRTGFSLKKKLKIDTVPTTVLIARNSKKFVVENGYRRFFYLDEVVKLMQGKRHQGS